MKENIRQHFNKIFADAPKTRKSLDLKQEMIQNAIDKYDDMVADGYSEEDAYQNVINSIGDVTELFSDMEEKNLLELPEKDRKKKAMLKASAVGIYILAGAVFFFCGTMYYGELGFILAILLCIPSTVMLVYAANMYPEYTRKREQDMVEQYKEVKHMNNKKKAIITSINSIIWTMTLVVYFLTSFVTYRWDITWIIFLIAACVQSIVKLVFELKSEEKTENKSVM